MHGFARARIYEYPLSALGWVRRGLAKPDSSATVILGIGGPLVIGLAALLLGAILMVFAQYGPPEFFRRKPETAKVESTA